MSWTKEARKIYNKKYYQVTGKPRRLQRAYGLTVEQHKQVYVNQNGCCAVCSKPVAYDDVHTDHNHTTGIFRGLLCVRCNHGMGYVDDKNWMAAASDYKE